MKYRRPIHWRFVSGVAVLLGGVIVAAAVSYYALYQYMDGRIDALEADLLERGVIREMDHHVVLRDREEIDAYTNRVMASSGSDAWDSEQRLAYADSLLLLEGIEEIPGTRGRWVGTADVTESDWATRGAAMLVESAQYHQGRGDFDAAWERIVRALAMCNVIGVDPFESSVTMLADAAAPIVGAADALARVALPPEHLRVELNSELNELSSGRILGEMVFYSSSKRWESIRQKLSNTAPYHFPLYSRIQSGAISFTREAEMAHGLRAKLGPERLAALDKHDAEWIRDNGLTFANSSNMWAYRNLVVQFARHEARCDHFRLVLSIEMYREAHGRYPDGLNDLVPEYVDAVPMFAFSGAPFWYAKTAEGFTLRREAPPGTN